MLLWKDLKKSALPTFRRPSKPSRSKIRAEKDDRPFEEASQRRKDAERRSRSSYPAHEYERNDRFTDSSHRAPSSSARGGWMILKAEGEPTPTTRTECTSNRTSTVYALRLQPFHFLSVLPLFSLSSDDMPSFLLATAAYFDFPLGGTGDFFCVLRMYL